MTFTMKVVQGKPHGACLDFPEGEFVVGRGTECQVRLNSELISRQHCLLRACGDAILVRDLGSTNGTLVNGKLIDDECLLAHGDTLQVGQLVLELDHPQQERQENAGGAVQGLDSPRRPRPVAAVRKRERAVDTMERRSVADTVDDLAAVDANIQKPKPARDTVDDMPVLNEIERLVAMITQRGLEAALPEIENRPDLMKGVAEQSYSAGLFAESQYLRYLRNIHGLACWNVRQRFLEDLPRRRPQ